MESKRPDMIVVADVDALAQMAARRISARLKQRGGRLAVCLTGGSTPERLYAVLAAEPYRNALPWERIHWFWGDDRFVPHNDPRSNYGAAQRLLLDHVPVPPDYIHAIPTSAGSVEEAARLYEADLRGFYGGESLLSACPLFDVVLMGLGADGHTASFFPDRPERDEKKQWVVGVPEAGFAPFVPRVTLTFPALASTHEMLFLVSGSGKRGVLTRLLAGADLPAAQAYSEGELVWLVDRDAAPELHDAVSSTPPTLTGRSG